MKIVAIVGLCGSGKSEVSMVFKEQGFEYVRFGQLTIDELKRRNLPLNEANERMVREGLRKEHGMAAFAKLMIPVFDKLLPSHNIVADGLYSWEEYLLLKELYKENIMVLAVYASPETRYCRLTQRKIDPKDHRLINRPFTLEEAKSRDFSQIENLHQAGPIAMADYTIVNENSTKELRQRVEEFIRQYFEKG